ncbi:MAG: ribbon-helix-helix protein, CopG family [Candidatus Altiarchaeales archaeon]|nr:ribbon-helix-helix protein, CopG family [Candidatus Altiarchaeales archaeon]MBD3417010.1 ribbon-helix-helix protein, CopG family [Candidatus Altiarchaeales archaeon]
MAVISVSVDEETISELDLIISEGGFKGRSDAFRTAVKLLAREQTQQKKMRGRVNGLLILIHDERHETAFTDARHRYEDLIKTSVHNQLGRGKCLEIFLLEGEAKKVKELMRLCRSSGRAEYLKLVTT